MTSEADYLVLGATGLVGSALKGHLERAGSTVLAVDSRNYAEHVGAAARVLVNCNGNTYRYKAEQDPPWDFDASVRTVVRSLFDFRCSLYVYVSTIDVYNVLDDPARNAEESPIRPERLPPYAFHKWLAERVVERYATRYAILRLATVIGPGLKKNPVYDLLHDQPIFVSPDSELSLIDVETVARAITTIADSPAANQTINVAPTGSINVRDVAAQIGVTPHFESGTAAAVYRYHINNEKMSALMSMPTSRDAVARFLQSRHAAD